MNTTPSTGRSGKRIAIIQSSYLPWKGYFDLIRAADETILFDEVQYTRRDWRNRNRIKNKDGLLWLTIPIKSKGHFTTSIGKMQVADSRWASRHLQALIHNYSRAAFFAEYIDRFRELYEAAARLESLSQINYLFLGEICRWLGIPARLRWSEEFPSRGRKTEKLVGICRAAGATHYLSGPSAQTYLDESQFRRWGIAVSYLDYSHYAVHRQLFGTFEHRVSIVDLIFNEGPGALNFLLGEAAVASAAPPCESPPSLRG